MKKRWLPLCLCALALALLTGCSKTPAAQVKDVPVSDLYTQITQSFELPAMGAMPEDMIAESYGVDLSKCSEYSVNMAMMNVHTAQLSIFKLQDAADAPAFEEGCRRYAASVAKTFEHYLPDQYELAQNPVIQTLGNYVFFAIGEDAAALRDAFAAAVAA
jgi:hypothetical protein